MVTKCTVLCIAWTGGERLSALVLAEPCEEAEDPDELSAHAVLRWFARRHELRSGDKKHRVRRSPGDAHNHQPDRNTYGHFPGWRDHPVPQLV